VPKNIIRDKWNFSHILEIRMGNKDTFDPRLFGNALG
jgi:hypothetical protein